ncbi:MAG TPA: YihY family inner membrane protein [Marinagarivorans sp.]
MLKLEKQHWVNLGMGAKIFALSLARDFTAAGCQKSAAALTYMTLFALVPLLMVFYSVFSMVPAFEGVSEQLQNALFANLLPESNQSVKSYLQSFSSQARNLTLPGIAMLFVTAFLMLTNIEKNFNTIWGVTQARRGMLKYLRYWAVLSIGPILLGMTMAMSTYVLSLKLVFDAYDPLGLVPLLFNFLPVLIMTMVFTLLFAAVPNCRVPMKYALIGGFVTALCFEFVKGAFGRFVANTSFELIYGAFAVVPLFLIWINLLWTIVLSGAILVRTLAERNYVHVHGRKTDLVQAVECLALFHKHHKRGDVVSDKHCYRIGLGVAHWQSLRQSLISAHWIVETSSGDYALCRSFSELTLWDLVELLDIKLADFARPLPAEPAGRWGQEFSTLRAQVAESSHALLNVTMQDLLEPPPQAPDTAGQADDASADDNAEGEFYSK